MVDPPAEFVTCVRVRLPLNLEAARDDIEWGRPSLLLIDDDTALLEAQRAALDKLLGRDVEIRTWAPERDDDPRRRFDELVDANTILVVTDYDLTTRGQTGLFGLSIVGWCQQRAIPVGDFSRGAIGNLPSEPNLFRLRVPINEEAPRFISNRLPRLPLDSRSRRSARRATSLDWGPRPPGSSGSSWSTRRRSSAGALLAAHWLSR